MKRAILGSPHSLAHHTIAAASLSSSRVQELLKHITCKRRDVCTYMPPLIQDLMSRLHLAVTVPGRLLSSFDQAGTSASCCPTNWDHIISTALTNSFLVILKIII